MAAVAVHSCTRMTVRATCSSSSSSREMVPAAAACRTAGSQRRYQPLQRASLQRVRAAEVFSLAALDIDWSDPDTQIGAAGAFLGILLGVGAPMFYASRDDRDEERLEELRALNRATKEETGEYMSPEEIAAIRPPRWTDRREFVDDD